MAGNAFGRMCCFLLSASVLLLGGCTHYVAMDDPSLKPFVNMYAVDRGQYGLSPLSKPGKVFIDKDGFGDPEARGYDVMLHIYNKASHEVVFRKDGSGYKWVGEQEQCRGPREYDTVKGRFHEKLTISYFQHTANQLDGLHISYVGPDQSLGFQEIPIPKAKQLLQEWGCE